MEIRAGLKLHKVKYITALIVILFCAESYSQTDTAERRTPTMRKFSAGGIFINLGTGLKVPLGDFYTTSNSNIGILGRLEVSTSGIFPFVPGAEVSYFVFKGDDEFMTTNRFTTYTTRILGLGLSVEYALSRLLKITYAIPFIAFDVKYNKIEREIAPDNLKPEGALLKETGISAGIGAGITLFLTDIYFKFNYLKGLNHIGVYAKIRFPVIRF